MNTKMSKDRPPYESGEVWTTGLCPGDGFELSKMERVEGSRRAVMYRWRKKAEEIENKPFA